MVFLTSLVDTIHCNKGFEEVRRGMVHGEFVSPQGTVGVSGDEELSRVDAMIVHGPFEDSPSEIELPPGTDSVIFIQVAAPITGSSRLVAQATVLRILARWSGPIG